MAYNRLEVCYLYPMICFPNGKINLGLRVVSKRPDGFHNIETLFYPVPIRDVLEFLPADTFQLNVSGLPIDIEKENNLIYKTWVLLHNKYKIPPLQVHLHKTIPPGSGLGGGSANVAFFIKATNTYFELGLNKSKMKKLAGQLGSDCPFFIENKAAFASGKGEVLQTANISLKGKYLLIIKPKIQVSTQKAYSIIRAEKPEIRLSEIISKPIDQWKNILLNDFEKPIFKLHPEIGNLKNNMYSIGAAYASMTGSGSAVFGIFENKPILKNINPNNYFWAGKL